MTTLESLVGREDEVDTLRSFLLGDGLGAEAVVLEGPAGIGKTSIWRAGVDGARAAGIRVLVSRPSLQDSMLGFVGIADLLDEVDLESLEQVPAEQLHALHRAVVRRDGHVADPQVVYAALLSTLRALAGHARLIVAIDDVQWLDEASFAALTFAARRLERADVRFAFTLRVPAEQTLRALIQAGLPVERVPIEPLTFGAVAHLLHSRLSLRLPRSTARRVYEVSAGNPLFALELGRAIRTRDTTAPVHREIPLPDQLDAILANHVDSLHPTARRALLAVSLTREAKVAEIVEAVGRDALEQAERSGAIVIERTRVRPFHPLIGEVVKSRADPGERRELHRTLAAIVPDAERRALHLSESTLGEDSEVAAIVSDAAAQAHSRSAAASAAELGERALELTPANDPALLERRLDAAEYRYLAGALHRTIELLPDIHTLEPGPSRARAALLRAGASLIAAQETADNLRLAVAESDPCSRLGALARLRLSVNLAVATLQDVQAARVLAEEALATARRIGDPGVANEGLAAAMWCRAFAGQRLDPELSEVASTVEWRLYDGTSRIQAIELMWRGCLEEARAMFHTLLALADERGEAESYFALRVQLCELELRAGRWDRLAELLSEWEREPREVAGHNAALQRFQAFLAVGRGRPEEAERLAEQAIGAATRVGIPWHALEAWRAMGVARLLDGDVKGACAAFVPMQARIRAARVDNPGAFPVAPDLIQALAFDNRLSDAEEELRILRGQASDQDNAWAHAAAWSSTGYVKLAAGDDAEAAAAFDHAAGAFAELGMRFDQARSLTALGAAQRRMRRRREARATLESAAVLFDELGSFGWAEMARSELGRVGGRRPSGTTLTPTEQRVAELVASGLANKQVAAALVVSVGTVEAHLTRIYAKYGVRSRTEMVRAMAQS